MYTNEDEIEEMRLSINKNMLEKGLKAKPKPAKIEDYIESINWKLRIMGFNHVADHLEARLMETK
jgi:hypothetical protein